MVRAQAEALTYARGYAPAQALDTAPAAPLAQVKASKSDTEMAMPLVTALKTAPAMDKGTIMGLKEALTSLASGDGNNSGRGAGFGSGWGEKNSSGEGKGVDLLSGSASDPDWGYGSGDGSGNGWGYG